MRFFVNKDITSNTNTFYLILMFNTLSLLFITTSIIYYNLTYGFSYEKLYTYFFTDFNFPEKVSIKQVAESVHINLFLNMFLFIMISSVLSVVNFSEKFKIFIIINQFISLILYSFSDLIIFYLDGLLYLKPFSFLLFTVNSLLILILSTLKLVKKNLQPSHKTLKLIILFFSVSGLVFITFNFFIFYNKIGFLPIDVKSYFLGSEYNYTKPKTLEGLIKVFFPHMLTMVVYTFVIAHFLNFTGLKRSISLILSLTILLSAILDNLSSLMIRYLNENFVYLKLVSFVVFEVSSSIALLYIVLKVISSFKMDKTLNFRNNLKTFY